MNNLLGIDYGERYIGLAIKKNGVNIPYAHKVIDSKKSDLIEELKKTIKKENITTLIIGYPKGLMNKETRMSKLVDSFVNDVLKNNFNLPIIKIDERLTSKIVNTSRNKRMDDLSAIKLLETYISNV